MASVDLSDGKLFDQPFLQALEHHAPKVGDEDMKWFTMLLQQMQRGEPIDLRSPMPENRRRLLAAAFDTYSEIVDATDDLDDLIVLRHAATCLRDPAASPRFPGASASAGALLSCKWVGVADMQACVAQATRGQVNGTAAWPNCTMVSNGQAGKCTAVALPVTEKELEPTLCAWVASGWPAGSSFAVQLPQDMKDLTQASILQHLQRLTTSLVHPTPLAVKCSVGFDPEQRIVQVICESAAASSS